MAVRERDPLSGHETTGHEWNGITELNTRVPRAVWWFIGVTHVYALVIWVLMPAWPMITTYTKGILGYDTHERVAESVVAAHVARSDWMERIAETPVEAIRADPMLMAHVDQTAPALWGDNCSACHGPRGAGALGFPSLIDDDWLWGGDPDTVMETLRVGINSTHPETRYAQMLAFGADQLLSRDEIRTVVDYVQSLSGTETTPDRLTAGEEIYALNCASCHGDDGGGMHDLGAPNLTDDTWIYGGSDEAMFETVYYGRQGWMPHWEERLSLPERKMLTVYIEALGEEVRR